MIKRIVSKHQTRYQRGSHRSKVHSTQVQLHCTQLLTQSRKKPCELYAKLHVSWCKIDQQITHSNYHCNSTVVLFTTAALRGVRGHSEKYATGHFPEAQCAFKILMIHEVLQFALRIAFRCVLHRCGSLDIRC